MMSYDLILTPLLKAKMGGRVIKVRLEVAVTVVSCSRLDRRLFQPSLRGPVVRGRGLIERRVYAPQRIQEH